MHLNWVNSLNALKGEKTTLYDAYPMLKLKKLPLKSITLFSYLSYITAIKKAPSKNARG
jgi:hypothetical protein